MGIDIMDMSERMIFIIGPPRSGSTLLERMIASHSQVQGGPEPHLLTPLAHLGYYETVEKAPYDHLRAVEAQRQFVSGLPGGESDYLTALRMYCNALYGRALEGTGKTYYLDKTPAYALILPFIERVFPKALYVVLTRHPGAIFSSYAESFFEGDWERAHEFNPIIERYVPAIARFLRESEARKTHVRYEDLVKEPEKHMQRICDELGLPFEAEMIEYKQREEKGLGDPFGVGTHRRPVTSSVAKWVASVAENPQWEKLFVRMIEACNPEDLETWGFPVEKVFQSLEKVREMTREPGKRKRSQRPMNRFRVERMILHRMRRNIHRNAFGRLIKRIRFACDVLLR